MHSLRLQHFSGPRASLCHPGTGPLSCLPGLGDWVPSLVTRFRMSTPTGAETQGGQEQPLHCLAWRGAHGVPWGSWKERVCRRPSKPEQPATVKGAWGATLSPRRRGRGRQAETTCQDQSQN